MRIFHLLLLGWAVCLALGLRVDLAAAETETDGFGRRRRKKEQEHYGDNIEMTTLPTKKGGTAPAVPSSPAEAAKWPFNSSCMYSEVEIYRPGIKEYLHARTYDPLAPIAGNQQENLKALQELLTADFMTQGVASVLLAVEQVAGFVDFQQPPLSEGRLFCSEAKDELCHRIRDALRSGQPCKVIAPVLNCSQLNKKDMEAFLEAFEAEAAILPSSPDNECGKAYAEAVSLYHLVIVDTPLSFSETPMESEEMKEKLNLLFAENTRGGPTPAKEGVVYETVDLQAPNDSGDAPGKPEQVPKPSLLSINSSIWPADIYANSEADREASMVELKKLKNRFLGKPLGPPETTTLETFPYEPEATRTLHYSAARRLFFIGARSPLVALLYNLLFQAWYRWDELFTGEGAARPFPRISTLLRAGSQERYSRLDALCGVALKKVKPRPKTPSTLPILPREKMFRKTRVVGEAKFSCDILHRAATALDLGESAAVVDFNERMESLNDEKKRRSVLLEHNASGSANFRRVCLSFRKSVDGVTELTDLLSCSFSDTVLPSALSASTSSALPPNLREVSEFDSVVLLETKAAAAPAVDVSEDEDSPQEQEDRARRNFNWLRLRAAPHLEAGLLGDVLSLDYGTWWISLLFVDERSLGEVEAKRKKLKATCAKAAKSKKSTADDGVCTATWNKRWWDKNCSKNLTRFLCTPVLDVLALDGQLTFVTSRALKALAANDLQVKKPGQSAKGRPFASLAGSRATQKMLFARNAYAPAIFGALQFFSTSTMANAELLGGLDHPGIWDINFASSLFTGKGKRGWLFSRLTGSLLRRLGTRLAEKAYQPYMMQLLHQKLRPETRKKMFQAIQVIVHPLALKHLNQMAPLYSDSKGNLNKEGGFAEEIDNTLREWSEYGMNEKLIDRLEKGQNLSASDFAGVNILTMPIPSRERMDSLVAERLNGALKRLQENPENVETSRAACDFLSHASNSIYVVNDSRYLLNKFGPENLLFLGKIVKRSETLEKPQGFFARSWAGVEKTLKGILRLPPYMVRHFVFAAVKVREDLVSEVVREMAAIYNRFSNFFKDEIAFRKAVSELSIAYEDLLRQRIREPFAVPTHSLLDNIHPDYAQMDGHSRNQEFQASALSHIFSQAWSLFFSVSMNNYINPEPLAKIEAEYSTDAWKKSVDDHLAVNSFRMIFMGSDMPLKLYDQLIPNEQKRMLKRAKFGVSTMFAYQTLLTGRLYEAQNLPNLGMFLQAQGPYFGPMIVRWQQRRRTDRLIEIVSWLTLGAFCFAAVGAAMQQTTQVVEQIVQNQSSLAPELSGCPPMGICMDGTIGDPIASPPATAASAVFQSIALVGVGMMLGPAVAIWKIAVSHFKVLARFEMAIGNAFRRMGQWFRKKWRGRWFANKQNAEIEKEMQRHTKKMKEEQKKMIDRKAPNLIDQAVPATAPELDLVPDGPEPVLGASTSGSGGGFFEIASAYRRRPRFDRLASIRRHDALLARFDKL
ncbi:cytoadherence-linked asexual protein [Toxoplasma gondii VAND]|uniref:Cytoadherence-linked asexual protein n=1 Tax=Toxoplasma gondii VAND TaxID=933077 RepID=A0A086PSJ2_TOXGO|nr:cytoadherence-linked asexual protein [Toxoplasma gondii VAND]